MRKKKIVKQRYFIRKKYLYKNIIIFCNYWVRYSCYNFIIILMMMKYFLRWFFRHRQDVSSHSVSCYFFYVIFILFSLSFIDINNFVSKSADYPRLSDPLIVPPLDLETLRHQDHRRCSGRIWGLSQNPRNQILSPERKINIPYLIDSHVHSMITILIALTILLTTSLMLLLGLPYSLLVRGGLETIWSTLFIVFIGFLSM